MPEIAMPEIKPDTDRVTQITVAEAEDGKQEELLSLMKERARFMSGQPGFVSISLHRGHDGRSIVNYVQWASREQLAAAHPTPEFRANSPAVGGASAEIHPHPSEVPPGQA